MDHYDENGKLHNLNGPAKIRNGYFIWYKHGIIHRDDCGCNGEIHENCGPAIVFTNKNEWRKNGLTHRISGPAVVKKVNYNNLGVKKSEFWYFEGLLHREECGCNGEIHDNCGPAAIIDNGEILKWYQNGVLCNYYGPSILKLNGEKEYYINGKKVKKSSRTKKSARKIEVSG